jgi:outer membrane protein, multidrug efflux system
MKRVCLLGILGMLLAPAGCSFVPQYARPTTPMADQYPMADHGTSMAAGADRGWREFFTDPCLRWFIGLALTNNLDLREAALRVEQSRAQFRIAHSALAPNVAGGAGYSINGTDARTTEQWSASLGATAYEVDIFGRVRSLNRQALERFLATEEARRGMRLIVVAEVASQYHALRQAQEQTALARRTLAAVREAFAMNQATFDAGASTELDLRTAEGQVHTARVNLLAYERQAVQATNALTLLIGRPMPEALPAGRDFAEADLLPETAPGMPSELLQRRPDLLEAEHGLKAANASIGAARAAFFPSVTLTGSTGSASSDFARLFGSGTGVWNFSPQVTLPIFTAGRLRADLAAAEVGARIEVARYEKAIQTAFREVADALAATAYFSEELRARSDLVTAQERRHSLAEIRYRQGEDNYLVVLSAQQDLYAAQQGLLQARLQKINAQIALYRALGGGWH